jgi:hypothetical protein
MAYSTPEQLCCPLEPEQDFTSALTLSRLEHSVDCKDF